MVGKSIRVIDLSISFLPLIRWVLGRGAKHDMLGNRCNETLAPCPSLQVSLPSVTLMDFVQHQLGLVDLLETLDQRYKIKYHVVFAS